MWSKVNAITGKHRSAVRAAGGPDPLLLNAHYAATSTDHHHRAPLTKSSCLHHLDWPTEQTVFNAQCVSIKYSSRTVAVCLRCSNEHLKHTATGLDGRGTLN
jgi:hypothetical protein